jgi:hypothetical protein
MGRRRCRSQWGSCSTARRASGDAWRWHSRMGIVHIQDSPALTTITSPFNLTLGSTPKLYNWLLFVFGGYNVTTTPTAVPSGGGVASWTTGTIAESGTQGTFSTVCFGQITGTPSTTVTVTMANLPTHEQCFVSEFSGLAGLDAAIGANGVSASAAPGSLIPTDANELFMVAYNTDANAGITAGPGGSWTTVGTLAGVACGSWQIVAGQSSQDPAATLANSTLHWAAAMGAFFPSSRGELFLPMMR